MDKYIYLIMVLPVVLGQSTEYIRSISFYREPATFDEASNICKKNDGNLAVVASAVVEEIMLELFSESDEVINASHGLKTQAFIGLQLGSNGWKTIYGDNPQYLNWSKTWWGRQQPDHPTIQKCGSLLKEGGMDDVHCHYKLAFFCENEDIVKY